MATFLPAAAPALLALLAWGLAQAQPPLQGVPPDMARALESQRAGFEAYQKCVSEHRGQVDLHYAAQQVIQFRDRRAMLEAALAADPRAREQHPGGVEQMGAAAFARYRALGGSAASLADVRPVATPCPPPVPAIPQRAQPGGSSPITQSRQFVVPPGGALPAAPKPGPIVVDLQTQDPAKQMDIARRYRHSLGGVPQVADGFAEAMKWYRKAADQGYTPAMRALGDIYYGGLGTKMDVAEAERWYRRAADKGDADAMVALGKLLTPEYPVFRRRDEEQAARWYRKAAEQGHAVGMVEFAQALQAGRGVEVDKAGALEWYRRAAENGNAVAASWVAVADNCKRMGKPLAACL